LANLAFYLRSSP